MELWACVLASNWTQADAVGIQGCPLPIMAAFLMRLRQPGQRKITLCNSNLDRDAAAHRAAACSLQAALCVRTGMHQQSPACS
eukprot:361292-Chlamydomonas_euryale.AAC.2